MPPTVEKTSGEKNHVQLGVPKLKMENLLKKSKILLSNGDLKGSYEELSTIINNQRHGRSMIETVVKGD